MKTLFQFFQAGKFGYLKTVSIVLMLSACATSEINPVKPQEDSGPLALNSEGPSNGRQSYHQGPNYDLNVMLLDEKNGGSMGFIKFRQYENETQFIHLDTWVHSLEANSEYLLQRAVDTTIDGNCTGVSWLTLGKGLVPQAILTDDKGSGKEELFRSVSSIPVGSIFDIHFRIIKESTAEVVLSSGCYQYTVR